MIRHPIGLSFVTSQNDRPGEMKTTVQAATTQVSKCFERQRRQRPFDPGNIQQLVIDELADIAVFGDIQL